MTTTEKPLASAAKAPGAATEKPTTASPASKGAGVPPLRKKSSASTSSVGDAKDKDKDKDKITKRRAARACVSCRARKVRCDVVEGAPCGNCRWDNVECIVQESRRRKKNIFTASNGAGHVAGGAEALRAKPLSANPISITSADLRKPSTATTISMTGIENSAAGGGAAPLMDGIDGHMPHLIYQRQNGFQPDTAALLSKLGDASNPQLLWSNPVLNQTSLFGDLRTNQFLNSLEEPDLDPQLPAFIKPLPSKIAAEDEKYLKTKGALTLPSLSLQSGLLKAYIEFVHPYMPIIELHDFLAIVNSREGFHGQVSLFLYQAVMFSATAFVGTKYLKEAGYSSRRAARKDFFTKTRLLYDFDYESDRLVLVQALLLMTYWYETPDDQKDTWHWMGVAISLAHTIGLHRNPANTNMAPRKQKLWKRIWWSCFMRDRLIALGMRRPTRIKDEDYDVPMLEMADFEIEVLASDNQIIPAECLTIRDISMQQQLAEMCVQKTRLCVLVSQMLKAQYSVLIRDPARPDQTTNSTMMLFPNKTLENVGNVNMVDLELTSWLEALPPSCKYRPITSEEVKKGQAALAVQRSLLHMVYYTTISALHRPQFLPSSPLQQPSISRQIQEMSRMRVRDSANQITNMVAELHKYHLEKFLPTTGVTVILPAMIIHLLEMKNPLSETRERATRGFQQCMQVMVQLREIYAAADFATGFLDAALRKASIDMAGIDNQQATAAAASLNLGNLMAQQQNAEDLSTPPPENAPYLNSTEVKLYHSHRSYMQKTGSTSVAPDGAGHSPPPTEKDLDSAVGLTPSASGSSEGGMVDGDFGMGQESIDWNAVSGTNLDFDQWLQFPAEGVNNTDDAFMGMFDAGEDAGHQALPTQTLSWAGTADDKMDIDGQAGLPVLA